MFFRIIIDAYKLFDRRWLMIIAAGILSVGVADIVSLVTMTKLHLPTAVVPGLDGKPLNISYNVLIDLLVFFLAGVWFDSFVSLLAKSDMEKLTVKFNEMVYKTTAIYPRVLTARFAAQVIMYVSLFLAYAVVFLNFVGILLTIPAFLFAVWFSIVSPVAVIEGPLGIRDTLIRSRALVHGYFFTVLLAMLIGIIPPVATADIQANSILFWPVLTFVHIATSIIVSVITVSTYLNLRAARGGIPIPAVEEPPVVKELSEEPVGETLEEPVESNTHGS